MKKIIFSLLILMMWALPLSAATYNSPFGFSIDVPSHWLIISSKEIEDNLDLFTFEHEMFKDCNKDVLRQMKNMVVSGDVEIYLNKQTSNSVNNDNINVIKTIERLPQTVSEQNQFCAKTSQDLSEVYGKLIKVYECEFRKVAG